MACLEFIGGYLTNSTAILSDALHDLGDSLALGSAWFLERHSNKSKDDIFSFGYRRFSLLSALINSLILLVGSIFILNEVFQRFMNPSEVHPEAMMAIAILGIVVNGFSFWYLSGGKSLNEKTISLHLLEDFLGWIAIFIGAAFIYWFGWHFLDPILSILITLFILKNVFLNFKSILYIFLQGTPKDIDLNQLKKIVLNHPDVQSFHHIHVWSLDGEKHILTGHVVLKNNLQLSQIVEIQTWMQETFKKQGIWHSTIQFEISSYTDSCKED